MRLTKGLAGPALIYVLTNALTATIPFLLLPVFTRLLTPDEYGLLTMFLLTVSITGAFTGVSVHGAVGVRYFQQDTFDFARYVSGCMVILISSTCVVALLSLPFLSMLAQLTHLPRGWLLGSIFLSSCQFIVLVQLAIFQSAGKPWRFGALRIAQFSIDAIMSIILVVGFGYAWQGRAVGVVVAVAIVATASLIMMRRDGWIRFALDAACIRDALRFGLPLVPHSVGGILIVAFDRFLISTVVDVSSTGIYTVALQIGMVLGLITDSFNKAFAPWLYQALTTEDVARDRKIIGMTYVYFVVVISIALLLGWMAPLVLGWLVGEEYQEAAPLVIYITLGFAFGGMYLMVTNYVFFAGKTAALASISVVCGIVNAAVSYALLVRFGLRGAAQAYMIVQGLLFLATWVLAQRSRPMPWRLFGRTA